MIFYYFKSERCFYGGFLKNKKSIFYPKLCIFQEVIMIILRSIGLSLGVMFLFSQNTCAMQYLENMLEKKCESKEHLFLLKIDIEHMVNIYKRYKKERFELEKNIKEKAAEIENLKVWVDIKDNQMRRLQKDKRKKYVKETKKEFENLLLRVIKEKNTLMIKKKQRMWKLNYLAKLVVDFRKKKHEIEEKIKRRKRKKKKAKRVTFAD